MVAVIVIIIVALLLYIHILNFVYTYVDFIKYN